jgi:sugar/nucleoside kinase (ribokinase family)
MSRVVVAGVVNVRAARRCEAFPLAVASSAFDPGGISIRLSGTGWTVARTLQQLGSEVLFATYVGADELGQFAAQGLRRCGLLGQTTLVCPSQPRALVLYGADGRRANVTDLRATPDLSYPPDIFAAAVDHAQAYDIAILANIGFTRPLISMAVDRGLPIATDLHLVDDVGSAYNRDWMVAAQILACSHEALPTSPEGWVRAMWRRYGTEIVLVGCGAGGAVLGVRALRQIWHVAAATPRGLRYTSGAGDTLLGSFVHHYLALDDPLAAVRNAVLTAGWKVGGDPDEEPGVLAGQLHELRTARGLPDSTRR